MVTYGALHDSSRGPTSRDVAFAESSLSHSSGQAKGAWDRGEEIEAALHEHPATAEASVIAVHRCPRVVDTVQEIPEGSTGKFLERATRLETPA